MRASRILMASLGLLACGGEGGAPPLPSQTTFGGERPTELRVPARYDGETPLPLVMVLHGHSATGNVQLAYSRLGNLVDGEGVFVLAPDGLVNPEGNHYWNATDACCDFYDSKVDDSAYLRGLIDEVSAVYAIDPQRIFLWGHSNGGFMAYRMACEHAGLIAGVVSLAGATHLEASRCSPTEPVSVLQIHGDFDDTIRYEGGDLCEAAGCNAYPSVEATLDQWTDRNGCASTRTTSADRLDLDSAVPGDDTRLEAHDGCPTGIGVDLWVIEGGGHIPNLRNDFGEQMWGWMSAHAKP